MTFALVDIDIKHCTYFSFNSAKYFPGLWIGRRGQAECLTCDVFLSAATKRISADQNKEKIDEMEQQIPDAFEAFPLDFFKNSVEPVSSSLQ